MRPVVYHSRAKKYLQKMPENRRDQLKRELHSIAGLEDPTTHPEVKMMTGEWRGCYRLRVGKYRAIFAVEEGQEAVEVLFVITIGSRGDVY